MNTDNGALHFESDIDNKKLDGAINETTRRIQGMSDATVSAGAKMDKVYQNLSTESTNFSTVVQQTAKQEIGRIEELRASISKLTEARDRSTSIEKIEEYNKRIKEETQDLKELTNAGLENADTNKKQEESTGSLSAMLGKLALSIGGAAAILGTLKKAFIETTSGLNAFNVVGAITSQILYNIVTGATSFTDKISGAIQVQKQFNALRLEGYVESYKAAQLNNQYQQEYAASLDATLSREDRIKTIDQALKTHDESIELRSEHVRKALEATRAALQNQPGKEKFMKEYASLMAELENLDAERYESTKRLIRQRSILIKEGIDEELKWKQDLHDSLQKLADEQIEIDNSVAEQVKLLQKAVEDGNTAEVLAINARIKLLQKELDIRINIAKAAILTASGGAISKIDTSHIKVNVPFVAPTLPGLQNASIQAQIGADLGADRQKNAEDEDREEKKLKNKKELLRVSMELTAELGKQLGLDDKVIQGFEAFGRLIQGDFIGAAAQMLSNLISLIPNQAAKFAEQIAQINMLLKEQQRLVDASNRTGGGQQTREDEIKMLEAKRDDLVKQLNYAAGQGKNTDQLLQDLFDIRDELERAQQDLKDFMVGGITENSIADAIAQGFQDGKTSVNDFASYMDDTLRGAVMNIFKQQILNSPEMKKYMDYITTALSNKILTPDEKATIDAMGADFSASMKPVWDMLMQGLGISTDAANSATSLTGSIKGITEQTADVVAGQMNAMRINQVDSNGMIRQQLLCLTQIATDTKYLHYLEILESIDGKMSSGSSLRSTGMA